MCHPRRSEVCSSQEWNCRGPAKYKDWNARYTNASGNPLADFRLNVTAESQGRLQVCRLYEMTDDSGVRDMLPFLSGSHAR